MLKFSQLRLLVTLILLIVSCDLIGQATQDSLVPSALKKITNQQLADSIMDSKVNQYKENRNIVSQKQQFEALRIEAKKTIRYFQNGIDTLGLIQQISELENLYATVIKDNYSAKDGLKAYRNLTTTEFLLNEFNERLEFLKKKLNKYKREVNVHRNVLDSMKVDSAIYRVPSDSNMILEVISNLTGIIADIEPADSLITKAEISLQLIDRRLSALSSDISRSIFLMERYRKELTLNEYAREQPIIFSQDVTSKKVGTIFNQSSFKAYNVLKYFFGNHIGKLLFVLLSVVLLSGLFIYFKHKNQNSGSSESFLSDNDIFLQPIVTACFIITSVSQFLFPNPPYAVQGLFWIIAALLLWILHFGRHRVSIKNPGVAFLSILCLLAILNNFMLVQYSGEKWVILLLAIAAILVAFLLKKNYTGEIKLSGIIKFIFIIFLILEFIAVIAIIFGRYNMAKTAMTAGYFSVFSAIILYKTYTLIFKAFEFYLLTYSENKHPSFYHKIRVFVNNQPGWLKFIFIFAWVVIFIQNFYLYSLISEVVGSFLSKERVIGKYQFTVESITIFASVLFLSGLLSKIVSVLTKDVDYHPMIVEKKKGGISNWMILIRLSIIVIGVLLAFAAAGLPMDRLTIIISSLSVGIGFGLQNIVSNLISGVILAFERPVEIGDQIEIAGRTGRIKEIGIRSSKIINLDGAEVIIPNGDLLNQHVINWTLTNNHRRVEILVGVKYGSDLYKVKAILEKVLHENSKVKKNPQPLVLLNQFNNSSIDFRLLFWSDISFWIELKSEIILSISEAFKKEGIEIPYSQQDIYIKEMPDIDSNKVNENDEEKEKE